MKKYYHKFWFNITLGLSIVFIVLFFPSTEERMGTFYSGLYTIVGLIVIWGVYLIRAIVFTKMFSDKTKNKID